MWPAAHGFWGLEEGRDSSAGRNSRRPTRFSTGLFRGALSREAGVPRLARCRGRATTNPVDRVSPSERRGLASSSIADCGGDPPVTRDQAPILNRPSGSSQGYTGPPIGSSMACRNSRREIRSPPASSRRSFLKETGAKAAEKAAKSQHKPCGSRQPVGKERDCVLSIAGRRGGDASGRSRSSTNPEPSIGGPVGATTRAAP